MSGYKIIIDTREQTPLSFPKKELCLGSVVKKLATGDYSIEGLEKIVSIERKKYVSELAQNLSDARFHREMDRMTQFKYKMILCEFDWEDILGFPYNAKLPKSVVRRIRMKGKFLINTLVGFQTKYNIHIQLAGNTKSATQYVEHYLKYVWVSENPKTE